MGIPARADRHPATRICRPGPSNATVAKPAWKGREPRGGTWTVPASARWPTTDKSRRTSATINWRHCCHQPQLRSASREEVNAFDSRGWARKPRAVRASTTPSRSAAAESSKRSQALRVTRFTLASHTPGWSRSVRSTERTHPPHFMPSTSRSIVGGVFVALAEFVTTAARINER